MAHGADSMGRPWWRLGMALAILAALASIYLTLSSSGALDYLREPERLRTAMLSLGLWGPLSVVVLMLLAVVVSPVPSAPIALAAGTAYGHTFGTLYVLTGAEMGALAAFVIARLAGKAAVERWLGQTGVMRLKGSQGMLMAIVFLTRLVPFVSFDAVSYAAGLTPLSFWRFGLATLAGILPASFLLAHFGAGLASNDAQRVSLTLMVLGLGVLLPLVLRLLRRPRGD